MENPWIPYLYQYIVGGLLFAFGILVPVAKGVLGYKKQEDRWTLRILILGFVVYAAIHGIWIAVVV